MSDKINEIAGIIGAGNQFDPYFVTRLADANNVVNAVVANLANSGDADLIALSTTLSASFVNSGEMDALSMHVGNTLADLPAQMDTYSTVILTTNKPANSVSQAFGATFGARTFLTAIDELEAAAANPSEANTVILQSRVNTIVATPTTVSTMIAGEGSFYSDGTAQAAAIEQANKYAESFADFSLKAVLGAVANTSLLNLLKDD
jgi:hypothetical protein